MTRDRLLQHALAFDPTVSSSTGSTDVRRGGQRRAQPGAGAGRHRLDPRRRRARLARHRPLRDDGRRRHSQPPRARDPARARRQAPSLRSLVVGRCLLVRRRRPGAGLPLAYAATKSFAHLLYGVRPLDPLVGERHRRHRPRSRRPSPGLSRPAGPRGSIRSLRCEPSRRSGIRDQAQGFRQIFE